MLNLTRIGIITCLYRHSYLGSLAGEGVDLKYTRSEIAKLTGALYKLYERIKSVKRVLKT